MPYAPTVNDRSGEILARGIGSGVDAIIAGMETKAAERRKKEEEKQLQATLGPVIEQLSGGAIKLEDAPRESWPMLFQAAQSEMQRPLRELQQRNAELENMLRSMQVEAEPGRMAQDAERAGLENELARLEVEAARNPPPSRVGQTIDIGGRPGYWQNDRQVALLPGGEGAAPQSPFGKLMADLEVARRRGDAQAAQLLEELVKNTVARSRPRPPDPTALRQANMIDEQIADLDAKIAADQKAIAKGDDSYGVGNVLPGNRNRAARIAQLEAERLQLQMQRKQLEQAFGLDGAQSSGATVGPSNRQTVGPNPLDPDTFFQGL